MPCKQRGSFSAEPAALGSDSTAAARPGIAPASASTPTWTKLTPAPHPSGRAGAVMVYDAATGNVVLFGGYRNGYVSDTWTWG
jgi:hypothetical protein